MGTDGLRKMSVVFEFLSLRSPRAVVVDFSVALLALTIIPTAFWDRSFDLCVWHRIILPLVFRGVCPTSGFFKDCHIFSCGMTHAFSALLHGHFSQAYEYNRLVYIIFALILFFLIYNVARLLKQKKLL